MSKEEQRPPPSLQSLLPCDDEITATQVMPLRAPPRSIAARDTLQPMALTLLSVEERLLLIDASTPLQGLSRLQKLVLAVSMQVPAPEKKMLHHAFLCMRASLPHWHFPPRCGCFPKAPKFPAARRMQLAFSC